MVQGLRCPFHAAAYTISGLLGNNSKSAKPTLSIIGLILFSLAQNLTMLLISRILIGVGVGACLMGPLTAYRIWFQDETQQRANSWMLMVGAIGMLSSSLPVQFFLPIIGWRAIFLFLALLTLVCIILIVIFIPNCT